MYNFQQSQEVKVQISVTILDFAMVLWSEYQMTLFARGKFLKAISNNGVFLNQELFFFFKEYQENKT